jgi:SecD/SecF fusion protein
VAWALATLLPLRPPVCRLRERGSLRQARRICQALDEAATPARPARLPAISWRLSRSARSEKSIFRSIFPACGSRNAEECREAQRHPPERTPAPLQGPLQLGLDLGRRRFHPGGRRTGSADVSLEQRQGKAHQGDRDHHNRINGLGVSEPIIRPVGTTASRSSCPASAPRTIPRCSTTVKKPARLDFRIVHPPSRRRCRLERPPGYEILTLGR